MHRTFKIGHIPSVFCTRSGAEAWTVYARVVWMFVGCHREENYGPSPDISAQVNHLWQLCWIIQPCRWVRSHQFLHKNQMIPSRWLYVHSGLEFSLLQQFLLHVYLLPKLPTWNKRVHLEYDVQPAQRLNHVGINAVASHMTVDLIAVISHPITLPHVLSLSLSLAARLLLVRWHPTHPSWHWEVCLYMDPTVPAVTVTNTCAQMCAKYHWATHSDTHTQIYKAWILRVDMEMLCHRSRDPKSCTICVALLIVSMQLWACGDAPVIKTVEAL